MTRTSLTQLEARDSFIPRHIGPSESEQAAMLSTLGYASRGADRRHRSCPHPQKSKLELGQFFDPMPEQAALAKLKGII
ncbi:hypothetical protein LP420_37600 [Massilia sp. B-10]|nr:hypothetical protein LP420_37600 [Massilia sp. B-10]